MANYFNCYFQPDSHLSQQQLKIELLKREKYISKYIIFTQKGFGSPLSIQFQKIITFLDEITRQLPTSSKKGFYFRALLDCPCNTTSSTTFHTMNQIVKENEQEQYWKNEILNNIDHQQFDQEGNSFICPSQGNTLALTDEQMDKAKLALQKVIRECRPAPNNYEMTFSFYRLFTQANQVEPSISGRCSEYLVKFEFLPQLSQG